MMSLQISELAAREREAQASAELVALQTKYNNLSADKAVRNSKSESNEQEIGKLREVTAYQSKEIEKLESALNEAQRVVSGLQHALRVANTDAALVPQFQVSDR